MTKNEKRHRAIERLIHAQLHLMDGRNSERARAILFKCEEYVRNGFRGPITYEQFQFDQRAAGTDKLLYSTDSLTR